MAGVNRPLIFADLMLTVHLGLDFLVAGGGLQDGDIFLVSGVSGLSRNGAWHSLLIGYRDEREPPSDLCPTIA
jgi:hypothetical protein